MIGELRCDVCDFSFADTFGRVGAGFIEAHHTIPVSELKGNQMTKIPNIALVCSNCHRILHRSKPMLSIAAMWDLLSINR